MPTRITLGSGNFEEHNKKFWEEKEKKELELRKGCTCEYYKLKTLNLKNLQQIYTHTKECALFGKK